MLYTCYIHVSGRLAGEETRNGERGVLEDVTVDHVRSNSESERIVIGGLFTILGIK